MHTYTDTRTTHERLTKCIEHEPNTPGPKK